MQIRRSFVSLWTSALALAFASTAVADDATPRAERLDRKGDRIDLTGIVYIGNGATADVALLSADGGVTTFTISANNGYNWTGAEFI